MAARLYKSVAAGLAVSLRVTPNAARARIDGIAADADGAAFLKIAVTVAPEDGKANAAVIKLLAKEWRLPKTSLSIASGARDRRKTLVIAGDARELETKLIGWLKLREAA